MFNYYVLRIPYQMPFAIPPTTPPTIPGPSTEEVNAVQNHQKLKKKYRELQHLLVKEQEKNRQLKSYIRQLQRLYEPQLKKKRQKIKRRPDEELEKGHACPFQGCRKSYASELSLSFHMRDKHNAGTKTERIAYLKALLKSRRQGLEPPNTQLNLPSELIEYETKLLGKRLEGEDSGERAQEVSGEKKASLWDELGAKEEDQSS